MLKKKAAAKKEAAAEKKMAANSPPDSPEKCAIKEIGKSPLKLANLTATLKMAGIIPYSGDDEVDTSEMNAPGVLIRQAIDFVTSCAKFLEVLKKDEDWRSEQDSINRKLKRLLKGSTSPQISVEQVLEVAGLDRLKLTPDELKELRIKEKWTDLTPRLQARAVFLYLSRPEFQFGLEFPNVATGSMVPSSTFFLNMGDEEREKMAESGIDPMMLANNFLIKSLCQAKQMRESKNATDRAYKSHAARGRNDAHDSSGAKSPSDNAKQKIRSTDGRFSKHLRDENGQFGTL